MRDVEEKINLVSQWGYDLGHQGVPVVNHNSTLLSTTLGKVLAGPRGRAILYVA